MYVKDEKPRISDPTLRRSNWSVKGHLTLIVDPTNLRPDSTLVFFLQILGLVDVTYLSLI